MHTVQIKQCCILLKCGEFNRCTVVRVMYVTLVLSERMAQFQDKQKNNQPTTQGSALRHHHTLP